jgi:hypothetical protein
MLSFLAKPVASTDAAIETHQPLNLDFTLPSPSLGAAHSFITLLTDKYNYPQFCRVPRIYNPLKHSSSSPSEGGLFYQTMNDEICRKRPIVTRGSLMRERQEGQGYRSDCAHASHP